MELEKENRHLCASGACKKLAENIEFELRRIESEPFKIEGEARALKLASNVLSERFLKRAKAEHLAGNLSDESWTAVHDYVRGCVGQLLILSNEAEAKHERAIGQLAGMKNSLKIANGHAELHASKFEMHIAGESALAQASVEEEEEPTKDDTETRGVANLIEKNSYKELKTIARGYKLPIGGTKEALADRIHEFQKANE